MVILLNHNAYVQHTFRLLDNENKKIFGYLTFDKLQKFPKNIAITKHNVIFLQTILETGNIMLHKPYAFMVLFFHWKHDTM